MGHLSKPKEFSDCSVSGSNENASDSEGEIIRKSCRRNFFGRKVVLKHLVGGICLQEGRLRANLV